MATIDEIANKILQDAEIESKERLDKSTERAGEIIKSANQEAAKIQKDILAKADKDAAEYVRRAKVLAGIEIRKEKLKLKQRFLKEALEKTLEKLKSMPDEDYCNMIAEAIVRQPENERFEILLTEKDKSRIQSKLEKTLAKKAKEKGIRLNTKISNADTDISGGFIIRMGDIEMNYSFDSVMSAESAELRKDILGDRVVIDWPDLV